MNYKLPDKIYQVLKWLGLIACPALATFYGVVAPLWGLPNVEAVVTTINAFGVLIGALIGYSTITASEKEKSEETNQLVGTFGLLIDVLFFLRIAEFDVSIAFNF